MSSGNKGGVILFTRNGKKIHELCWKDFIEDFRVLQGKLERCRYYQHKRGKPRFTHIVGIERGGLIPAVMLSHFLKLPLITCRPDLLPILIQGILSEERYLFVDDLVDTGKTLKVVQDHREAIAVVYWKKRSKVIPDFWGREMPNTWIKFPYETEDR